VDRWARSFDGDPDGYAAGRPGYPASLFDLLERRCGLGPGIDIVEIGPGTGQATAELLERGARVHAVEPGRRLAAYLRRTLGDTSLTVTASTFEDAALDNAGADLVVSATAFHWVDAAIGMPKVVAILRPGGWVAVWWNAFYDPGGPDVFSRSLEPLYAELGDRGHPQSGAARDEARWTALLAAAGLESIATDRIEWEVEHGADELVALYATFSDTRTRAPAERKRFLDGVRAAAEEHFGGQVRRRYVTLLYTARKPVDPSAQALSYA
jgi:SAM-dependent methyltransferase